MRFNRFLMVALTVSSSLALSAQAQSVKSGATDVSLCDPYLVTGTDNQDNGNDNNNHESKRVRYDQEKSEKLASDQEVMDLLFEEKWDLKTGAGVERAAMCQGQASYVVNWAEVMGLSEGGTPAVLADGFLSIKKDGTFDFTYNKRPYTGSWTIKDGEMTMTAPWLNKGQPLVSAVEKVRTPVEYTSASGKTDVFDEEVYRIGPFRLHPYDTTAKGTIQDCACPTN